MASRLKICDTPLWDRNLTWYSDWPRLTPCFEHTFLSIIPLVVLLLLLPLDAKYWRRNKDAPPNLPWNLKLLYKMGLNCFFIATEVVFLWLTLSKRTTAPFTSITEPLLQLLGFTVALVVCLFSRRYFRPISRALNVFWFFVTLTSLWKTYSAYLNESDVMALKYSAFVFLGLQALIDSSFPDVPPETSYVCCPLETVPFFSRLYFVWMLKLFDFRCRAKLQVKQFFPLCKQLQSHIIITRYGKDILKLNRSLQLRMFQLLSGKIIIAFLLEFVASTCSLMQPITIGWIIDSWQSPDFSWHGIIYGVIFALAVSGEFMIGTHRVYHSSLAGLKAVSLLSSAIYRKCFRLSPESRKQFPAGEIANMLSVDVQEIFEYMYVFSNIFTLLIRFIPCMWILCTYLGSAVGAVLVSIAVMLALTWLINRKVKVVQDAQMKLKDQRIAYINEALKGIKVIKFHAWEKPFAAKVALVRLEELKKLRVFYFWNIGYRVIWMMSPWIMAIASFIAFLLIYPSQELTSKTVFVSLSIFLILREPTTNLTYFIGSMVRAQVSFKRVEKLLRSEDLPEYVNCSISDNETHVYLNQTTFSWEKSPSKFQLQNINMNIKNGALVAVVGKVGSGKSSLLAAIIGDMYKIKGEVYVNGSVSYVPQEAWIQNLTVKENILFARAFNDKEYHHVLDSCALSPDLRQLPAGDLTEIGERGVNLSGGQKQRISLARAVYQKRDIYLLDDPLSAVDAHVANHLFEQVIGPKGILKGKTRILATHHLGFLPHFDWIIVLDEGMIVYQGSYQDLEQNKSLTKYLTPNNNNQKDEDNLEVESKDAETLSTKDITADKLVQDEECEIGIVAWRHYLSYLKAITVKFYVLVLITTITSSLSEVSANFWLARWMKKALFTWPLANLFVYAAIMGLGLFCAVLGVVIMFWRAMKASASLHGQLLEKVLHFPVAFFETNPLGRIINRFSRDIYSLDESIPDNLLEVTRLTSYYLVIYFLLAINSIAFLFILVTVAALYYIVYRVFVWTTRQLQRLSSVSKSPLFSFASESVSGIETIRAFRVEREFCHVFAQKLDLVINAWYTLHNANRTLECWVSAVGGLATFSITCVLFYNRHRLSAGQASVILNYAVEALFGIFWFVRVRAKLEVDMVAMERIGEYFTLEEEKEWTAPSMESRLLVPHGKIEFRNYSTSYRKELGPVLKNINLLIESGQKVGIVGRTGAGKSSLLLAVFRIVEPTNGTILIDDVDITSVGLHDVRKSLTIIPQDSFLFAGTLRLNLDPWREHKDHELWSALEKAHLVDYFRKTSAGLDFEINEGGSNLSVGQKQLVCLARALLRKTKILVLDEATASVDLETDKLIQKTIRENFSDCTILTIAHRLQTILDYDRILVLASGHVVEDGSPQQLLARPDSEFLKMAKEAGICIG